MHFLAGFVHLAGELLIGNRLCKTLEPPPMLTAASG
jgi:hypothetical protein